MSNAQRRAPRRETRTLLLAVLALFFLAGALGGWVIGDAIAKEKT